MENTRLQQGGEYLGAKAFIPLLTFLGIYLGAGLFYSITGHESPFRQIPRETAILVGITVALFIGKDSWDDKIDIFSKAAGDKGVILMCLIFLLAGAFSGVAKEMGAVESTVNLGLTLVPKQFIFAGIFIISAAVATAMGTSMGTIAAVGPIAVGLAEKAEIHAGIAIAAVLCGAMFGDNLSIISDTTIAATRGVGAEMKDKFRMNGIMAGVAAIAAVVMFSMVGVSGTIDGDFQYNLLKILPYVVVLVTAIMGMNVIFVLLFGTVLAGVIGLVLGSFTIIQFAKSITSGMAGMYSIVVVALLIRGLTGLASYYGGIDWLLSKITKNVKTRKGAELGVAGLVSIVDAALANNTIAIIVTAPLALQIGRKFNIAPKRLASLLDIFSCIVQGIIPHGGQMLLCMELTGLSLFEILPYGYYFLTLTVISLATIFLGLMRTKEEKEGIDVFKDIDVEAL